MNAADRGNTALWTILCANIGAIFVVPPEAFVWLLVVDLITGSIVLGFMYLRAEERADHEAGVNIGLSIQLRAAAARTLKLKREVRRIDAIRERVVAENHRLLNEVFDLHLKLTEAELAAGIGADVVPVPLLKYVPASHEVSDYEWPAIARVLEIEGGEPS
jgi:hypothetical protein